MTRYYGKGHNSFQSICKPGILDLYKSFVKQPISWKACKHSELQLSGDKIHQQPNGIKLKNISVTVVYTREALNEILQKVVVTPKQYFAIDS